MKMIIAAAALAVGSLLTTAVGVAHADEIELKHPFNNLAACQAAGASLVVPADQERRYYFCEPADNGLWYVVLTNAPYGPHGRG